MLASIDCRLGGSTLSLVCAVHTAAPVAAVAWAGAGAGAAAEDDEDDRGDADGDCGDGERCDGRRGDAEDDALGGCRWF